MAKQIIKQSKKVKAVVSKNAKELVQALNLPESTPLEWQIRHEVIEEIIKVFSHNEMTITALAEKAQTSRARITRILKKDTSDISLDVLLRVLGTMGQRVSIKFLKAA